MISAWLVAGAWSDTRAAETAVDYDGSDASFAYHENPDEKTCSFYVNLRYPSRTFNLDFYFAQDDKQRREFVGVVARLFRLETRDGETKPAELLPLSEFTIRSADFDSTASMSAPQRFNKGLSIAVVRPDDNTAFYGLMASGDYTARILPENSDALSFKVRGQMPQAEIHKFLDCAARLKASQK